MSNIIDDADVTHYSSQFENKDFYITENDIADLDLFFMVKTNGILKQDNSSVVRIVREPVFYFSCSSHTAIAPVFGVGHDGIVGYSRGNTIYAGKIITNAFHNIPLINLLIEAEITSGDPADLPPLDFYIVNKKRKESDTKNASLFQDCVIENLKILNWNFEQGVDTPGRFFVFEFVASSFKGIHLKRYIENQLYYNSKDVSLTPNLAFDSSYDINTAKNKALENAADTVGSYAADLDKIVNNIKNSAIILTATSETDLKNLENKILATTNSFSSVEKTSDSLALTESLTSLKSDIQKAYEFLNLRKANDSVLSGLSISLDDKLIKTIKTKPQLLASLADADIFKRIKITFNSEKNPGTFFERWNSAKSLTAAEFGVFQKANPIEIIFLRPDLVNTETGLYSLTLNDVSEYVPKDVEFTLTFSYEQTKDGVKNTFASFSNPITLKSSVTKAVDSVSSGQAKDLSADIVRIYTELGFVGCTNPVLAATFENNTTNYKHGRVNELITDDLKELAEKLKENVNLNIEYRHAAGESIDLFTQRVGDFTNSVVNSRINVVGKSSVPVAAGSASSIYVSRVKDTTAVTSDEAAKFPFKLNTEFDIFLGFSNDNSTYTRLFRTDEKIKLSSFNQFANTLKGTYQINFIFYTDTYITHASQNKNILAALKSYADKIIKELKVKASNNGVVFSYNVANIIVPSDKYKNGDKPALYSKVDAAHSEEFGSRLNRRMSVKIVKVV